MAFSSDEIFESFQEHTKSVETYKKYDFEEGYTVIHRPYYKAKYFQFLTPQKRDKEYMAFIRGLRKKRFFKYKRAYKKFYYIYKLLGMKVPKEIIAILRKEFT